MASLVEESIRAGAAPETVWRLLTELSTWRVWWPELKNAESIDRRPLADGSSFEYTLEGRIFPSTHRATVEVAQPNRALIWIESGFGIVQRRAFYLEAGKWGTTIRERATIGGGAALLWTLAQRQPALSAAFQANLRGLKKAAERS